MDAPSAFINALAFNESMQHGADVNALDADGRNPMYYSRKSSINAMLHDAMTGIYM